jgi:hypothetical protein
LPLQFLRHRIKQKKGEIFEIWDWKRMVEIIYTKIMRRWRNW